jgi:ubiquinone/menaquinone biosynthesis C-methylase UbiE
MVDIGCGTGVLTDLLVQQQHIETAVGIDFVNGAIDYAKKSFPKIDFRIGALPFIELPDEKFDFVVASEVLYYLNISDRRKTLCEISRILRPEGFLLFSSRLGKNYFSVESAEKLIEENFSIAKRWFLYSKLYHLLSFPARALKAAQEVESNGTSPGKYKKIGSLLRCYGRISNKPVFSSILRLADALGSGFMRSPSIPVFCNGISRFILPGKTRSNIVIFARKV